MEKPKEIRLREINVPHTQTRPLIESSESEKWGWYGIIALVAIYGSILPVYVILLSLGVIK